MTSTIKQTVTVHESTSTTGSTGNISLAMSGDVPLITVAVNNAIAIPFLSNNSWFVKVLNYTTMQPVANTEVDLTYITP